MDQGRTYLLDEVQEISGWEKVVNSFGEYDVDIYMLPFQFPA